MTNRELKEELQEIFELGFESALDIHNPDGKYNDIRKQAIERIEMLADTLIPEGED